MCILQTSYVCINTSLPFIGQQGVNKALTKVPFLLLANSAFLIEVSLLGGLVVGISLGVRG
jgi:hypothetical protein